MSFFKRGPLRFVFEECFTSFWDFLVIYIEFALPFSTFVKNS